MTTPRVSHDGQKIKSWHRAIGHAVCNCYWLVGSSKSAEPPQRERNAEEQQQQQQPHLSSGGSPRSRAAATNGNPPTMATSANSLYCKIEYPFPLSWLRSSCSSTLFIDRLPDAARRLHSTRIGCLHRLRPRMNPAARCGSTLAKHVQLLGSCSLVSNTFLLYDCTYSWRYYLPGSKFLRPTCSFYQEDVRPTHMEPIGVLQKAVQSLG